MGVTGESRDVARGRAVDSNNREKWIAMTFRTLRKLLTDHSHTIMSLLGCQESRDRPGLMLDRTYWNLQKQKLSFDQAFVMLINICPD